MATPYQRPPSLLDSPGLGFGTGFTSTGDMRRKVGGTNLSLNPRRVAQRRAQNEEEDRALRLEDRDLARRDFEEARKLQRLQLAATFARMGLAPDGSPLMPGAGVGPVGGARGSGAFPIAPIAPSFSPIVGEGEWSGTINPDGTVGFVQPTAPVGPVLDIPAFTPPGAVAPATSAVPAVGNPYLGVPNPGSAPLPPSVTTVPPELRAWNQFQDMGLRHSAEAAQNLANGRAAVAALQATQAQQNVDPWTRSQAGGNIVSSTPGATITRGPSGDATLASKYGTGSVTYGPPPAKSFTTIGADGQRYTAPSLEQWKQNEIGERALGRAAGADADLTAGVAGARRAQGRNSFLDMLEQIHQNATKRKA